MWFLFFLSKIISPLCIKSWTAPKPISSETIIISKWISAKHIFFLLFWTWRNCRWLKISFEIPISKSSWESKIFFFIIEWRLCNRRIGFMSTILEIIITERIHIELFIPVLTYHAPSIPSLFPLFDTSSIRCAFAFISKWTFGLEVTLSWLFSDFDIRCFVLFLLFYFFIFTAISCFWLLFFTFFVIFFFLFTTFLILLRRLLLCFVHRLTQRCLFLFFLFNNYPIIFPTFL